jgi:hypothetical protein
VLCDLGELRHAPSLRVRGRCDDLGACALKNGRATDEPRCVPLCGATKAYGPYVKWWQHEPLCPVRIAAEEERGKREREG